MAKGLTGQWRVNLCLHMKLGLGLPLPRFALLWSEQGYCSNNYGHIHAFILGVTVESCNSIYGLLITVALHIALQKVDGGLLF